MAAGTNHVSRGNGNGPEGKPGIENGTLASSEQVHEVLHVLFKRWRLAATLFILVALPGLIAASLRPPLYVATAKVLISTDRADLTIQPTDLTRLTTVNLNESVVNSEVHIIKSRELLEEVAQDMLAGRLDGNHIENHGAGSRYKPPVRLGTQILRLANALAVTPIRNSNVIQIDYRASDPKTAARIVNRVVDRYLSRHAKVHGAKGLMRFYEEQRQALQENVRRAELALQEFADREGIVDPKSEIETAVRFIAETEAALRATNAAISGAEEKIRAIREQIAEQPPTLKKWEYVDINPVVTTLSEQLAERQVDRIALLRKYTEKDRHVRDNAEEIAELERRLREELRDRPTVSGRQVLGRNPIRDERTRVLLELESTLREQRARRASLEEQLSAASRHLVQLRAKSLEYDRLNQEVKNWRATYELYLKREEEARVSEAMDREEMVNVEVVQRPALPLPRADNRQNSAMLALLSGLVVSIAGTFGVEYLNRPLKSERDVERYLGLPVLGALTESRGS